MGYDRAAFDPPKHKLSKLLVSGTTSLMLSQPENRIDLRTIMDQGHALLVDLSTVEAQKPARSWDPSCYRSSTP